MSSAEKAAPDAIFASSDAELRKRWGQALQNRWMIVEVENHADLRRTMARMQPSLLLLDLNLEGLRGLANLPLMKRQSAKTRIILFHGNTDHKEAFLAMEAGAHAFLDSEMNPAMLKKAIDIALNAPLKVMVLHGNGEVREQPEIRLDHLTLREREIANLIGSGASNKEIARRLDITEATVKAHLTTVFRKVGVADRLGLALLIRERPPFTFRLA